MSATGRFHYVSAIVASLLALFSSVAFAGADEGSDGQRPTGVTINSVVAFDDLQRCVTRLMAKGGRVTPVPIENGVALDMQMAMLFGTGGDARFSIQIVERQARRELTAFYRHPFSSKLAVGLLKDAEKRCALPVVGGSSHK